MTCRTSGATRDSNDDARTVSSNCTFHRHTRRLSGLISVRFRHASRQRLARFLLPPSLGWIDLPTDSVSGKHGRRQHMIRNRASEHSPELEPLSDIASMLMKMAQRSTPPDNRQQPSTTRTQHPSLPRCLAPTPPSTPCSSLPVSLPFAHAYPPEFLDAFRVDQALIRRTRPRIAPTRISGDPFSCPVPTDRDIAPT